MKKDVITTSIVTIKEDDEGVHLTNEVINEKPKETDGVIKKDYDTKHKCALAYANAILSLLESKIRKDRIVTITVEYKRYPVTQLPAKALNINPPPTE